MPRKSNASSAKTAKLAETDCGKCVKPSGKSLTKTLSFCSSAFPVMQHANVEECAIVKQLQVQGYGAIPVLNGDPKWLPEKVRLFICEKARVMRPCAIHLVNGSVFEAAGLTKQLVNKGVMEKLSAYDNVYLTRTDPLDTARVEKNTFISTAQKSQVEANRKGKAPNEFAHWMSPTHLSNELDIRFPGCMQGRVMYVIPFSMGPIGGSHSINAVQLTDSAYVVLNMRIVTRVSSSVWDSIGRGDFVKCIHSMGVPRPVMRKLVRNWPCNTERIIIAHRLPELEVWSYGSGYGGNSLLGKKCLALRIGSYLGLKGGWLAEHAAIISITDPSGHETFICASFPSGAGKTVMATMKPALPGWTVRVLGDDIAWIRWGADGKLYAMAPENGMFGIAVDTTPDQGEHIVKMCSRNALLVNTASTDQGKFMWQGLEPMLAEGEKVSNWKGQPVEKTDFWKPAHGNARFTAYTSSCPNVHPMWDSAKGVPISAYIFGARRPDDMPLVYETESWSHGVTMAAGMRTLVGNAVADKRSDVLCHDPMSMRPFLSYNFAQYVNHWLAMEDKDKKMPKIFHVNWYKPGADGKPLWPGYGENIRVLEWILKRCNDPSTEAEKTPIGYIPKNLNCEGLKDVDLSPLLEIKRDFWKAEIEELKTFFENEMSDEKPAVINTVLEKLEKEVSAMP